MNPLRPTVRYSVVGDRMFLKSNIIIEALGSIDEAVAALGHASLCYADDYLRDMQHKLYEIAGYLILDSESMACYCPISESDIVSLQRRIDTMPKSPCHSTISGANEPTARLDLARVAVRRCERRLCDVFDDGRPVDESVFVYVNLCSQYVWGLENCLAGE